MPPSSHSEMPPSSPSPVNGPNFIFHCSRRRLPIEAAKKLQSTSPVLGSPSVVKKARSLLPPAADDDVEDDNGTSSKVTTMTRQRFVASSIAQSASMKRECSKIWDQSPIARVPRKLSAGASSPHSSSSSSNRSVAHRPNKYKHQA